MKLKISAAQAIILLFLCRMFGSITYSPSFTNTMEGSAILLADLIAVGCTLLSLIPMLILFYKNPDLRPIEESLSISKPFGLIVCWYLIVVMILAILDTITHFSFFMTNAIFPDTPSVIITTSLLIACVYGAYMGLEGLSRAAGIIFFFFLLSTLFIFVSAWKNIHFINLKPIIHTSSRDILSLIIESVSHNTEYVLLLLLYPYAKGKVFSVPLGFFIASSAGILLIGTVTILILGDFTAKQMFPFYTVASVVDMGVIQRFDSIHMFLWVLVAYVRSSLYLIVAKSLLRKALPHKLHPFAPLFPAVIVWLITTFVLTNFESIDLLENTFIIGFPVLTGAVILPVILLIHVLRKKSCSQNS